MISLNLISVLSLQEEPVKRAKEADKQEALEQRLKHLVPKERGRANEALRRGPKELPPGPTELDGLVFHNAKKPSTENEP